MITKKVILIGDFATGKTSLIRRYVDNQFSDDYLTTIGVKISKKSIELSQDIELQLMIWDIEGHTELKETNPAYVMGAHGVIIVGDITRDVSLNNISRHIDLAQKLVKKSPIVIALNKADLIKNDSMVVTKVLELQESLGIENIFDTSAKDARNVDEIFLTISRLMLPGK